jgi:hypothetical protein
MADVASKPSEPVPLDTIPITPVGGEKEDANKDQSKVVTVFDDPSNFNVKHQLQHENKKTNVVKYSRSRSDMKLRKKAS